MLNKEQLPEIVAAGWQIALHRCPSTFTPILRLLLNDCENKILVHSMKVRYTNAIQLVPPLGKLLKESTFVRNTRRKCVQIHSMPRTSSQIQKIT